MERIEPRVPATATPPDIIVPPPPGERRRIEVDGSADDFTVLAALLQNAPGFMTVLHGAAHVFRFANRAYYDLVGERDLIGVAFRDALPELATQGIFEDLDEVFRSGIGSVRRTVFTSLRNDAEDPPRQTYVETIRLPYYDSTGSIAGVMVYGEDVTIQILIEQSMQDAQQRTRRTMDQLMMFLNATDEGFYVVDREGITTACNHQFLAMLGFERQHDAIGRKLHDVIHHSHPDGTPYDRDDCPIYQTARSGKATYVSDELFFRIDGATLPVQYHVYPIWDGIELRGALCIFRDITWRKQQEAALKESAQRFRSLFEQHTDGILSLDTSGQILSANPRAIQLSGHQEDALRDRMAADLFGEADRARIAALFATAADHPGATSPGTLRAGLDRDDAKVFEVEVTSVPVLVDGRCVGIYLFMRDITESQRYERDIKHLATHDTLTGLANRAFLYERLGHAIEHRGKHFLGLLFLDLDRFKAINDSLGHDKGDLLLQIVAQRLRAVTREGDTVARLGGDEFVILVEDVTTVRNIVDIIEKIHATINEAFDLCGCSVHISTSIGAAVFPDDGRDADTLLRHADLAMYEAKRSDGLRFRFFDAGLNHNARERVLAQSDLRNALDQHQLVLQYQPMVNVLSQATTGVEALIRWQHPERGLIAPIDFIPLAEETGLIDDIGRWALQEACRQNRAWQDAGMRPLKVSVNLSACQLRSPAFGKTLERALLESALDPAWLSLEIAESALMQDVESSRIMLGIIRSLGVSISIDDFGTGCSSLRHLKRLPIDTIKIDRSFIDELAGDAEYAMIVTATIALAHNLGFGVVAEGVTTADQIAFLASRNCVEAQGFLYSAALSAPEALAYITAHAG